MRIANSWLSVFTVSKNMEKDFGRFRNAGWFSKEARNRIVDKILKNENKR